MRPSRKHCIISPAWLVGLCLHLMKFLPSTLTNRVVKMLISIHIVFAERNIELLLEAVEEPEMATASSSSSTASSWGLRQQKAAQRWKEARPFHLKCLLDTHNVGHPVCSHCNEDAVIRWEVIHVDSCYIGFIFYKIQYNMVSHFAG